MRGLDLWQTAREKAEVVNGGLRVLRETTPRGEPALKMWNPKAIKPFVNAYFRSEASREEYVARQIEGHRLHEERKAKNKAERAGTPEQVEAVKPGAIFVNSWGYDQTNVDYYQVVERHGKVVTLREIACEQVPGTQGFMCAQVKPRKDAFLEKAEPFKKTLRFYGGRPCLSFDYGSGELVTPDSAHYCSWYA